MATIIWRGGAQSIPQVNIVTPGGTIAIGSFFYVTVNGKVCTYAHLGPGTTVADVTAGLAAALSAMTEPEFTELTFEDITTAVTVTGPADGAPFTQTSSAGGGGSPTLTTSTFTTPSGPNWYSEDDNWAGGVAPQDGDDVILDGSDVPILYGLDAHTQALISLTVGAGYVGTVGLPERAAAGYEEYRPTYLYVDCPTITIGAGQGNGPGRVKVETYANNSTINVVGTGTPLDAGVPAFLWRGGGTGHTVNVAGGSVGLAILPGESSTVTTLRVGDGSVWCGPLLTLTTLKLDGGAVDLQSGVTTVAMTGGQLTVNRTAGMATLNVDGGNVLWLSGGAVTTCNVSDGGDVDFSRDLRGRTFTNVYLYSGAGWWDPAGTVTYATLLTLVRCSNVDLRRLNLGVHRAMTVGAA